MIRKLSSVRQRKEEIPGQSVCQHRAVSKDGSIICGRIVEGDNRVSPEVCYSCPVRAVNCTHLRFSLCQTTPRPLVVRFNGRTEIWDDDPPELRFEQAACTFKVTPIEHPRTCTGCGFRQPAQAAAEPPARRQRQAAGAGKVVPFPGRKVVAATG